MFSRLKRTIRHIDRSRNREIDPDEIFLDASNLPNFDTHQLEGQLVQPISKRVLAGIGVCFVFIVLLYTGRLFVLQVREGEAYSERSENNRLHRSLLFADRGVIYDRTGEALAWNEAHSDPAFARRAYDRREGLAHVIGYVNYPQKDASGVYYQTEFIGRAGVEESYNDLLAGDNGSQLIEVDALGNRISESTVQFPAGGDSLTLSINASLQHALFDSIKTTAESVGFRGGAGVIMDVRTGEILVLTSYPEYDSAILSDGAPADVIASYTVDERAPFLDKILSGVYTPGSIVKPFVAIAALAEGIISPEKEILSTGQLVVPNRYNPSNPTIFRDWRAHGYTDMRRALAVSSDVYFYVVGGGFGDQQGLGIANIEKYARMFGLAEPTGIELSGERSGVIPNPAWKEENFDGEAWLLGNTYHTAIGQYGFQVTPIQMVRATAALANSGKLLTPTLQLGAEPSIERTVDLPAEYFQIVREGMRQGVAEGGTAAGLSTNAVTIAAKTGTAELGVSKEFVNSWVMGFYPYEQPKYAFVVLMERGPRSNLVGATSVFRKFIDWAVVEHPEYFTP